MKIIAPQTSEGSDSKAGLVKASAKLMNALKWARALAYKGSAAVIGRLKSAFAWLKATQTLPISIGTVVAPFVLATKTGFDAVAYAVGKVGVAFSRAITWVGRKVNTVVNTVLGWASKVPVVGGFFAKGKELYNTATISVSRGYSAIKNFGSALLYAAKNVAFVSTVTRSTALAVGTGAALLTAGVAIPFIPFVLGYGGVATIVATGTLATIVATVELIQGQSEATQTVPEETKPEAKKPAPAKAETDDRGLEALNDGLTYIKFEPGDVVKNKGGEPALIVPVQVLVDLDAQVTTWMAEANDSLVTMSESMATAAEVIGNHKPAPGRVNQPRAVREIAGVTYTRGFNADGSTFEETRAQFEARLQRIEADAASQASV